MCGCCGHCRASGAIPACGPGCSRSPSTCAPITFARPAAGARRSGRAAGGADRPIADRAERRVDAGAGPARQAADRGRCSRRCSVSRTSRRPRSAMCPSGRSDRASPGPARRCSTRAASRPPVSTDATSPDGTSESTDSTGPSRLAGLGRPRRRRGTRSGRLRPIVARPGREHRRDVRRATSVRRSRRGRRSGSAGVVAHRPPVRRRSAGGRAPTTGRAR